jgi:hypothetical protein
MFGARCVIAAIASAGAIVLTAPAAATIQPPDTGYKILVPLFDRTASVSTDGSRLRVSGLQSCRPAGAKELIRVFVTQRGGAFATGRWSGHCTADRTPWKLTAVAEDGARFDPGSAKVCGVGIAFKGSTRNDAFQWCANIRIVAG